MDTLKTQVRKNDSSLAYGEGSMQGIISISAIASISPLGGSLDEAWSAYRDPNHCFTQRKFGPDLEWVAQLGTSAKRQIEMLKKADSKYKNLDDSVLFAIQASKNAVKSAGWKSDSINSTAQQDFGINIGSSRGATALFEKYHKEFLQDQRTSTLSSPTTTLGNISSWVAHDLQSKGPEISHSITCSTALHAMLNGVAWLRAGMADKFLVGGSEAPLTAFTVAQMKALKIYANVGLSSSNELVIGSDEAPNNDADHNYPCRALDLEKKKNGLILGEGASIACLEKGITEKTLAVIDGIGFATEILQNHTSISANAQCFQRSMKMALGRTNSEDVDVIVMHAPGTIKGDGSEYRAIEKVFGKKLPALTTTKWKTGHTFGASGMLSIEMAVLMLQHQELIKVPYLPDKREPSKIRNVMVNAVGFGGNAVSILLKAPPD